MAGSAYGVARSARWVGGIAGGILGAAVLATGVVAVAVARTVVTPPTRRKDDVAIIRADLAAGVIVLGSTPDSRLPGEYSLWFSNDTGHAKLGDVLAQTPSRVTRRILQVDFGDLERAQHGRFSGWFWLSPSELGFEYQNVSVETPLGAAPAWHIPGEGDHGDWAILVHGRAVRRQEALRAVSTFVAAGYDCLVVSYRNDGDAPRSPDGKYALGDREWQDVEAAMQYALDHGARRIVLMGFSMGGATVMQAVTRSPLARHVAGVVLDSPVVDWIPTLDYQARVNRIPAPVRIAVFGVVQTRWTSWLAGLGQPISLSRLDIPSHAGLLSTPILLMHSDDDGYVPSTASHALAEARPDLVRFERYEVARHTKLWNYDAKRWTGDISDWLASLE